MNNENLDKQTARARELLSTVRYAAMATVTADGSPHNTPFFFMRDPKMEYVYWGSHPESLHSQNVIRTGKIFVVLYDAVQKGGLYIDADHGHILEGEELAGALAIHNELRAREGKEPLAAHYYAGISPQRMWSARISHFWVNSAERDANGHVAKDGRREVSAQELLQ